MDNLTLGQYGDLNATSVWRLERLFGLDTWTLGRCGDLNAELKWRLERRVSVETCTLSRCGDLNVCQCGNLNTASSALPQLDHPTSLSAFQRELATFGDNFPLVKYKALGTLHQCSLSLSHRLGESEPEGSALFIKTNPSSLEVNLSIWRDQ